MDFRITDLVLILTTLGTSTRWWFDRRDARSALALAKADADKAVTSLKEAVLTVKGENTELKEERRELRERIAHLEDVNAQLMGQR